MAADVEAVENLPDYPGSVTVKRLEGTLVAKRSKKTVPNHLTDTKIYTKVKKSGILQCKPSVIHFNGYRVGEVHQQTLRIINASRDNQQMHIIPPTTPYFSVKYLKQRSGLVPGMSLDVTVLFKPTKWQYYYDCVRVHCKGDQNLLIPIHAYPVMDTAQFPQSVVFPTTPLGQSKTKTLSLKCDVPIDFEFELSFLEEHPAFTVAPMKGIASANSETAIKVTFSPSDFSTACMKLQLNLSQFNSTPLICSFSGSSAPGMAVDKLKANTGPLPGTKLVTKRLPSLICTSRRTTKSSKSIDKPKVQEKERVYDGIRIPTNTDTPHAVSKVLSQKSGKMKASQLKQAMSAGDQSGVVATRQVKEAAFLRRVGDIASEERANQIRWVTQLGSVLVSAKEREQVMQTRAEESSTYKRVCHVAVRERECERAVTVSTHRRTRRPAHQVPDSKPSFDVYSNDMWSRRYTALSRFVQAARKVVLQLRCQTRLERLKRLAFDIKAGTSIQESLANLNKDPDIIAIAPHLPRSLDNLSLSPFPVYKEMSESSLVITDSGEGGQSAETVNSSVHKDMSFVDLKVSEQWQLLGYLRQSVPAYGSYVTPDPLRILHTGALDELSSLGHIPGVDPSFLSPITPTTTRPFTATTAMPTLTTHTSVTPTLVTPTFRGKNDCACVEDIEVTGSSEEVLPLSPPQSLFRGEPVHPMQLLNPCPGVATYLPMMDNSVITFDHVLKPLPAFPTAKYPLSRLNKTDVIPEVMQWKKFPNQYLVSTESERKLATLWKPQWNDPVSQDLLPLHANGASKLQLMSGPQPDDFVDLESESVLPVPTMEMVHAQFTTVPPEHQTDDTRLKALAQLEEEKRETFNQLGQKIKQKLKTYQDLLEGSKLP